MPSQRTVKSFVSLVQSTRIGYNVQAKEHFHRQGRSILRVLAKELGLATGEYDLRSNKAGIAVSGEITLHSDTLYVQFSQTEFFLWRTCEGRKDYRGGRNQWAKWDELFNLPALAEKMRKAVK